MIRFSTLSTGRFHPLEILLVLISVRGWVDPRAIVRSEELYKCKIRMTPSGIEPATYRFVAHHLNHCTTEVPLTRITGTLHEYQYTFLIISHSVNLRMRNVSDKRCRENRSTRFTFSNWYPKQCLLWDNVEKKYCRAVQNTIENMAHTHCMLDT